ncbi:glycosyltransferase family protein [Streptomyces sp. NPDC057249]|uniref:glycosyltransferase family protein n=1 Tax=Streptomyces sp. NPDC057249 TaxID=3346067 RepID=UPI00362B99AC
MRVTMYWHNGRSLGHTAESAKIASALLDMSPDVRFAGLTGAYRGLGMLPDAVDVVKLPSFANFDDPRGWRFSSRLGFPEKEFFAARGELAQVFLRHYAPDVFLVNHLPSGAESELAPALGERAFRTAVLTLRGVLFDRAKTNREYFLGEVADHIARTYDLITVHAPSEVFRLEEHYDVPAQLSDRIRYTGYLAEPSPLTRAGARERRGWDAGERVVVASMGGGQGAGHIWSAIARALRVNRRAYDRAVLVTGPYLEQDTLREVREQVKDLEGVRVVVYDEELPQAMKGADLFIGAAGSNMVSEVLSVGANAILIPRQLRESEQSIHAGLLRQRGLVRTAGLREVLDGALDALVGEGLAAPLAPRVPHLLGGARRYAGILEGLVG